MFCIKLNSPIWPWFPNCCLLPPGCPLVAIQESSSACYQTAIANKQSVVLLSTLAHLHWNIVVNSKLCYLQAPTLTQYRSKQLVLKSCLLSHFFKPPAEGHEIGYNDDKTRICLSHIMGDLPFFWCLLCCLGCMHQYYLSEFVFIFVSQI